MGMDEITVYMFALARELVDPTEAERQENPGPTLKHLFDGAYFSAEPKTVTFAVFARMRGPAGVKVRVELAIERPDHVVVKHPGAGKDLTIEVSPHTKVSGATFFVREARLHELKRTGVYHALLLIGGTEFARWPFLIGRISDLPKSSSTTGAM